jgi:periplasmic copper chaperone A
VSVGDLLGILPPLLIAVLLICGRYPGEELIVRLAERGRPRARTRAPLALALGREEPSKLPTRLHLLRSSRPLRGPPPRPLALCVVTTNERNSVKTKITFALLGLLALVLPGTAQAHVSLHPNEVPAGSFATLDIRVPNEMESANTVKLAVQVPPGFLDISTEYMPGWSAKVLTSKLAKPVQTDDGEVTEQVREIVWTGSGAQGRIPPGQFVNFAISTEIPGKAGEELTFKVLQYYDNGEVVRWIGGPSSDEPAPQIDVTAEGGVLQDVAGSETAPPSPTAEATPGETTGSSSSSGDSASKGLGIAALIVGALGLLAGGAALVRSRRTA